MIKTNQEKTTEESKRAQPRNLACWDRDPQASCLRVEVSSGDCFLLPYIHFVFAKFERAEAGSEAAKVVFTTHEIKIVGRNLLELCGALQKLSVDWIKELPSRYGSLTAKNAVYIESIEVIETEEE